MRNLLKKPCAFLPQRYVMSFMTVIGLIFFYFMRVSSIIALSEMTIRASRPNDTSSSKNSYCPKPAESNTTKTDENKAEFNWNQDTQHSIIRAFYIGYIVAQVPSGIISDAMGGKTVFGYGMLVSAALSLSIPTLARIGPYAFVAGRVIQGFGQGVMIPTISSLIAKWAPANEISRMNGIILSGVHLGNALGFIISGYILHLFPGWSAVFYISGGLGVIWCIGWYILVFSGPEKHPFITDQEREMISRLQKTRKKKPKKIPWMSMMTSIPFMSVLLSNFAHSWAIFTLINELPAYSSKVLNFNIKESGLSSAAPHLSMIVTAVSSGYLVDWLINKGYMSITNTRKVFSILANALPVPFLIGASYAGCNGALVVILLMIMMLFKGLSYATIKAIPVDMAPNYAGILMGFMNATGALAGSVSSFFTSLFITGDGSIEQWRNVFFLGGFVMIIFSLPFLCFGTAEMQPWNNADEVEEEKNPEGAEEGPDKKPQA